MLRVKTIKTITPRSLLVALPKFMLENWGTVKGDKIYTYSVDNGAAVLSTPTPQEGLELINAYEYKGGQHSIHIPVGIAIDKWNLSVESYLEVHVKDDSTIYIRPKEV